MAQIVLNESEKQLELLIKDEGMGFDKAKELNKAASYGFLGMKERVKLLEGTIEIISEPGAGTQILIGIPLKGRHNIGEGKSCNSR
jgi:two-component system sensor histidine kinase DegS